MKRHLQPTAAAVLSISALMLGGCAGNPATPPSTSKPADAPAAAPAQVVKTLFVAQPEDGRLYYFTDQKLYVTFLEHAEVALRQTRIGGGPSGQTVVFALTNEDVKSKAPSAAERLFDGKLTVDAKDFYGEVIKDGRFYVFDDYADMKAFVEHGEVGLAITDIGAGPKGETLVWVLNQKTAKNGRPTARIERFKALHGMK